jgi:tripartite-type tricarboxylate transporter receptor subunit TctC
MRSAALKAAFAAVALAVAPVSVGGAQTPEEFYKGKTIDLYIGYSVGGGYDIYARALAQHIGKHIPGNPTVVPRNMEGAGSLRLANWLYNVAPKDGTAFGIIGRGIPFGPLLGGEGSEFDATKFTYLGSMNEEVSVCVTWHTTGVDSFEKLKESEVVVGGTGPDADTDQFPRVVNGVLGTKLKVVSGFPGGNDILLAMERGELGGRCGWSWSSVKTAHADWVADKKINILFQMSANKHPDLADVPLIMDLAETDEQRQILRLIFSRQTLGRPFVAPPGLPEDRVQALRDAFMATLEDPEFLADAEKADLEITPVSGEDVQALVTDIYETPPELAAQAAELVRAGQ